MNKMNAALATILILTSANLAISTSNAQARLINKAPSHVKSSIEGSLKAGELMRTYRLYIPVSYRRTKLVPLVIVLHGGGGSGEKMEDFTVGGFNVLSEREGFIVAYPDAYKFPFKKPNWNDGRGVWEYPAQRKQIDDVGFISALIDHLVETYRIDSRRVYVTGASNGGIMTYRLGCELSEKLTAIAPVIGSLAQPLASTCLPRQQLPILVINGTTDPLVPWEGGDVHFGRHPLGKVVSVQEAVGLWAKRNGCLPWPSVTREVDRDPRDGTRVRQETYQECEFDVVLYAIEGGGHTWPGGYQYAPKTLVGITSFDIDACEIIWDFFKRHPRH